MMDIQHLIHRLVASGIPAPSSRELEELQAWVDRVIDEMLSEGVPAEWIRNNLNLVPVMQADGAYDVVLAVGSGRFRVIRHD